MAELDKDQTQLVESQQSLAEKWDAKTQVSPEEKGKYKGKTAAELKKQYNALKARGPHKKGSAEFGRMRELAFAIRAKTGWGKVEEGSKPDFLDLDHDGDRKEPMKQAARQAKKNTDDKHQSPMDEVKLSDLPVRQIKGRSYGSQPEEFDQDDEAQEPTGKKTRGRPKGIKGHAKGPTGKSKLLKKGAIRENLPPGAAPGDEGEYGNEGDMAKDDIHTIVRHARALEKILSDSEDLPEWVQAKLTKIQGMMTAVDDYMQTQHERDGEMDHDMALGEDNLDEKYVGFEKLRKQIARRGDVRDPAAVAASIGRKKYGKAAFQKAAAAGKKMGSEELDEKAVSLAQRRAAGIARAAQKGEIPRSELRGASRQMAKMSKKELHKFATTKEKGLPAKKSKAEVEETTTSGSVATAPAAAPKASKKGGVQYGKGIYDSLNRRLEAMISESMSVNINHSSEGGNSITVTATDEDAAKLADLLRSAGIGHEHDHGSQVCPTCGSSPCGCAEQVDENQPEWPTNTEVSNDAFQYSGGLNKPKTDVAGQGQTVMPTTAVRVQEGDQEIDEAKCMECGMYEDQCRCDESVAEDMDRILELAGVQSVVQESTVDAESTDRSESDKSLLDMSNLWKEYKGQ